ncbi:MAG: hypothetical protein K9I99_17810 [Melioribacteraceae bacterium]|nr:hypothetical protein [Melioribacteraceae bacterium]
MKQKIISVLEKYRKLFESSEMCYMAINGGFEFEVKNKLAYGLQENFNEENSISFIKEGKIRKRDGKTKIVDIISISNIDPVKPSNLTYLNGKRNLNKVISAIEIGHNYLSQPTVFMINKSTQDISKCYKAGIKDNLYIIQIATNITCLGETGHLFLKRSYYNGVKSHIEKDCSDSCLSKIRTFYETLDEAYKEVQLKNSWNDVKTEIHIFIIEV